MQNLSSNPHKRSYYGSIHPRTRIEPARAASKGLLRNPNQSSHLLSRDSTDISATR